jgi:hypothetical protein
MARKIAMTPEERHTIVCLRAWIPSKLPTGWRAAQPDIVRVNGYDKPGIFGRLISGPLYRLQFEALSVDYSCRVSLSNVSGAPVSDEDIDAVKSEFFSGRTVNVTRTLPGLVSLELVS